MSLAAQKASLRAEMRRVLRQAVTDRDHSSQPPEPPSAADLVKSLSALPFWSSCRLVLGYCAIEGELDPAPLLAAARAQGKATALPRIEGDLLDFRLHDGLSPLEPGPWGIPQPPADAPPAPVDQVPTAVLVLVPALAYDRLGRRLGRGKGFYDRLLSGPCRHSVKVGLCHRLQVLESIPAEPHDQRVDALLTPQGLIPLQQ